MPAVVLVGTQAVASEAMSAAVSVVTQAASVLECIPHSADFAAQARAFTETDSLVHVLAFALVSDSVAVHSFKVVPDFFLDGAGVGEQDGVGDGHGAGAMHTRGGTVT